MPEIENHCAWTMERIDATLDGDLTPEDASRFEAHLRACSTCSAEMGFARLIQDALRDGASLRCPETVIASVKCELRENETTSKRVFLFPGQTVRWALAAAALLAVVAGWATFAGRSVPPTMIAQGPSPAEVLRAKHDLRWTFAYVGALTRHSTAEATGKLALANPMPHLERVMDKFNK